MAKIKVKSRNLSDALNKVLKKHDKLIQAKANKGLRVAIIKTWGDIIKTTPVDTGRARGNWFIDVTLSSKIGGRKANKGASYVVSKTPVELLGTKLFLFNNLPYINTLEFGGFGDGPKTINGFSKQAPEGMVRLNLMKWPSTLNKVFKAL